MPDTSPEDPALATPLIQDLVARRWLAAAAVLALGMIAGGYLLGNGLVRAKDTDRSVTVRGLAERDVTADLAIWTIAYSATAEDLATAQASADRDSSAIRSFFRDLGFPAEALQPIGVNVSQVSDNCVTRFTLRQRMSLRSNGVARAQNAVRRQFELVRRGVVLNEDLSIAYTFTKVNGIKPEMVATKDARASAEQFAQDSGTSFGTIRSATQGYFEINARDGASGGGWGASDTPFKKVRVVTTVDIYLR